MKLIFSIKTLFALSDIVIESQGGSVEQMGLTIQRTVGEKVILTCSNGEQIIIEVKKASNQDALRLSFDAPQSVKIFREELVNNIN